MPQPTASDTHAGNDYPWAAIGDSFSAGPGAGTPFGAPDAGCFRNKGAYPVQLNRDFPFDNVRLAMQFLSCTGAVMKDVQEQQITDLNRDQGFILLSIGGNDVGFSKVLKACVFKPGGPYSGSCDDAIEAAEKILMSTEFPSSLRRT